MKTRLLGNLKIRKLLLLACLTALSAGRLPAQERGADDRNRPPPREGARGEPASLTPDQVQQAKAILAKYDPQALTTEKVRALHEEFHRANIPGGPAINEVVMAAGFSPDKLRELDPPPTESGSARPQPPADRDQSSPPPRDNEPRNPPENSSPQDQYSITQAISDEAQLHTIAFSGLAFITGDFGACTFMPPGKVCDFFGFQYMRDIDVGQKGHNPMFLDRVSGNVLQTLSSSQRALFEQAARQEAQQMRTLAEKRLPLIKAFCRQLTGDLPVGSAGLNKDAVRQYVGDFFAFDAAVSWRRAQVFGQVARSFTPAQKAYLAKMKFGDFGSWPAVDMEKYKLPRGTEKMINVTYMTYASEFFSWYAGHVEADTYFCPERHGTYFGGFYMKDMPAMGKRDYDISLSITGDSGKEFLNILTADQRRYVTAIPDVQRAALNEMVGVRRAIAIELRKFLAGGMADKARVLALGRRYGELDGEMSFHYATAFAQVNRTLTASQRAALFKLRNLSGYTSAPAYLYSDPLTAAPRLPDTTHFFFPPRTATK